MNTMDDRIRIEDLYEGHDQKEFKKRRRKKVIKWYEKVFLKSEKNKQKKIRARVLKERNDDE